MNLTEALSDYKKNELAAHVELDDVIIKVTQELLEMLEAKHAGDTKELITEAQDTIVNILSASSSLNICPQE